MNGSRVFAIAATLAALFFGGAWLKEHAGASKAAAAFAPQTEPHNLERQLDAFPESRDLTDIRMELAKLRETTQAQVNRLSSARRHHEDAILALNERADGVTEILRQFFEGEIALEHPGR